MKDYHREQHEELRIHFELGSKIMLRIFWLHLIMGVMLIFILITEKYLLSEQ